MGRSAVISCKNHDAGESNTVLKFFIDEREYLTDVDRRVSVSRTIDGGLVEDFGFVEKDRILSVSNIKLTLSELTTLRAMQQSSNRDYEFSDGISVWEIVLKSISEKKMGDHVLVTISMVPVEKIV